MAIAEPMAPIEPKIDNQKQMDADVMDVVKRKGKPKKPPIVEQSKEKLKQVIIQNKIDPQALIRAGKLASMALKDPSIYQMAVQAAIKEGLITAADVQPGIDYKLLSYGITAGKMAEELVSEGAI